MRQEVIGKVGGKKELKLRSLSIMEIRMGFSEFGMFFLTT